MGSERKKIEECEKKKMLRNGFKETEKFRFFFVVFSSEICRFLLEFKLDLKNENDD